MSRSTSSSTVTSPAPLVPQFLMVYSPRFNAQTIRPPEVVEPLEDLLEVGQLLVDAEHRLQLATYRSCQGLATRSRPGTEGPSLLT